MLQVYEAVRGDGAVGEEEGGLVPPRAEDKILEDGYGGECHGEVELQVAGYRSWEPWEKGVGDGVEGV